MEKSPLNDSVLVLNKLWQAVNIASVRRVFTYLANGNAVVLHEAVPTPLDRWRELSYGYRGDDVIRCPGYVLRQPSITLLTRYDRLPDREVRFTRKTVFERDGHRCQYCGKKFRKDELTYDHVIPRVRGGGSTWTNIVAACVDCNSFKDNRTPEEAGMVLLKKPKRPNWRPAVAHIMVEHVIRPDWKPFLDVAGWSVDLLEVPA